MLVAASYPVLQKPEHKDLKYKICDESFNIYSGFVLGNTWEIWYILPFCFLKNFVFIEDCAGEILCKILKKLLQENDQCVLKRNDYGVNLHVYLNHHGFFWNLLHEVTI